MNDEEAVRRPTLPSRPRRNCGTCRECINSDTVTVQSSQPLLPNVHHLFDASFNTLRLSVSQVVERRHPLDALPPSRAFGGSSLISSGVRAKSSPPLRGGGVVVETVHSRRVTPIQDGPWLGPPRVQFIKLKPTLMPTNKPFDFPPEMEREIFETAAIQHPKMIHTLLLVCHRVHVWVEPFLYRVIQILHTSSRVLTVFQSKPSTFLRLAVHHLWITPAKEAPKILPNCSSVHSLFLNGGLTPDLLDILDGMRVRKMSISVPVPLSGWPEQAFTRPAFRHVTHLDMYQDEGERTRWEDWSSLASLPALTHVCLSETTSSHILHDVLAECPRLVVVITAWWVDDEKDATLFAQTLTTTDPRVVLITVSSYDEDWKTGAKGGDDFWARAETFVARKRRGEIEKNCFVLKV
ncbi:hypothetical protein B0H16DRAFT_1449609 [Mycena metata]|uniref:Uncharacterized protein n=1 Tax=Mycena metata TaxID=1033252 RepID=A0AAD7K330_9AGAR|nr:hypothetical protein B0H16DRAFT_1449609 [Mycena metata]